MFRLVLGSTYLLIQRVPGTSQMKTPTWCNTVQVLFLQSHSTCFGRKRPSSGGTILTSLQVSYLRRCNYCAIFASKNVVLQIKTIYINHYKTLIQVSMLMLICYIFYRTHVPVAAVLVLNTPDDGRLRTKHVEWLCRNKTCTVLHQVGVSFDLYCDARKHKIKIILSVLAFSKHRRQWRVQYSK